MTAPLLLIGLLFTAVPAFSAPDPDSPLDVDFTRPAALQEANRVLAEEIKLAARPQTYVLIDLVANAIILKGRAVELHRIPITKWSAEFRENMSGSFRLAARPPVTRRKIDPSAAATQEPISLTDMPTSYDLIFHPALTIEILPAAEQSPLRWVLWQTGSWWRWLRSWSLSWSSNPARQIGPRLQLTLSDDHAQSFAWSLVDGMALVIRRSTDK